MDPNQNQQPQPVQSPQSADPSSVYPPSPGVGAPSSLPINTPPSNNSRLKPILLICILILLAAGAAAYFVTKNHTSKDIGGSVTLNGSNAATTACAPILASSLDQSSTITTYERFAKGVAAKNQTCANGLSSNYFLSLSKQEFAAPDGNWVSAKVGGLPPVSDDFAKLPSNFTDTNFKSTPYIRATILGSSTPTTPATGTTLSYLEQGQSGTYVNISFVLDSGYIKVDDLNVGPLPQS